MDGLGHYMDSMKKISIKSTPKHLDKSFSQGEFLLVIRGNFDDIISFASKSPNKNFIGDLAVRLNIILHKSIDYDDYPVFETILSIFTLIYHRSFANKSKLGKDMSIRYLLELAKSIFYDLEDFKINHGKFEKLKIILYKTVNTLMRIMKATIDNQDFDTFNEIQGDLSDSLRYYRPDSLWDRIFEIESEMRSLKDNQIQLDNLKNELNLLENRIAFAPKIELKLNISWFEAANYILNKIDEQNFFEEYYNYVTILLYKLESLNILLKIVESINRRLEKELDLDVWEEIPTKGKVRVDTHERSLLTFCLRGLQLVEDVNYEFIHPSDFIRYRIDQIKGVCNKIVEEKDKWKWLIGPDIENRSNKFIEVCIKSTENAKKTEEDKIIESKLSQKKINDFKKEIIENVTNSATMEPILQKFNRIVNKEDNKNIEYFGILRRLYKAYFIDDILYSHWMHDGGAYGRNMAESKDEEIIKELLKNNRLKLVDKNENPAEIINSHINEMKNEGYSPNLIIIPFEIIKQLHGNEFISALELRNNYGINNLLGKYDGIWVVGFYKETLGNSILIIDVEKGCELIQIEDLSIDVRTLNDNDKNEIRKQNPKISDKELDLEVLLEIREKFKFKITDSNSILKLKGFKEYSLYKSSKEYINGMNDEDKK